MTKKLLHVSELVKNREVLSESYIPKGEELLHRDEQIKEIAGYFSYVLSKTAPPHILLLGERGTGKTAIIRFLLEELREEVKKIKSKGETIAWIGYTLQPKNKIKAILALYNTMGFEDKLPPRGLSFEDMIMRWEEKTKDKISIMVIDEIDTLSEKDLNEILYHLSRRGKTGVIGITQRITIMNKITDPNVQSSFMPRIVRTIPYTSEQLFDILKKRVEMAFYPNVVEEDVIKLCAALAAQVGGDCRYGIQLLSYATDRVIREDTNKLTGKHIRAAQNDVEKAYIYEGIKRMKIAHKFLLSGVLLGKTEIQVLFNWYNSFTAFAKDRIFELSSRRLSDYLSELEILGYLSKEQRSMGRGKGFKWFVKLTLDKKLLEESLRQDPDLVDIWGKEK